MTQLFPSVTVEQVDIAEANALLTLWEHELGPCRHPFRQEAHAMLVDGRPLAVTISASTVSARCGDMPRRELVELARIARHPDERWVLRIWREVCAPSWACWPVRAAVSYALPGRTGDLYRFDGWERVGEVRPSPGGGTWSNAPTVNGVADGRKVLWRYRYPEAA